MLQFVRNDTQSATETNFERVVPRFTTHKRLFFKIIFFDIFSSRKDERMKYGTSDSLRDARKKSIVSIRIEAENDYCWTMPTIDNRFCVQHRIFSHATARFFERWLMRACEDDHAWWLLTYTIHFSSIRRDGQEAFVLHRDISSILLDISFIIVHLRVFFTHSNQVVNIEFRE